MMMIMRRYSLGHAEYASRLYWYSSNFSWFLANSLEKLMQNNTFENFYVTLGQKLFLLIILMTLPCALKPMRAASASTEDNMRQQHFIIIFLWDVDYSAMPSRRHHWGYCFPSRFRRWQVKILCAPINEGWFHAFTARGDRAGCGGIATVAPFDGRVSRYVDVAAQPADRENIAHTPQAPSFSPFQKCASPRILRFSAIAKRLISIICLKRGLFPFIDESIF